MTNKNSTPASGLSSASDKVYESKTPQCIRKVLNFSLVEKADQADTKAFIPERFLERVPVAAPKIKAMMDKIQELDDKDMKTHKKHFKHMIFTDISSAAQGYKVLASMLEAMGVKKAFDTSSGSFSLLDPEILKDNAGNNYGVLISKTWGRATQGVTFKKRIQATFNSRPDNSHGELIRFMILDQGFKEGVDMFDLKYVHLFEPMLLTDQKQAVGRGTRFCGQMGLRFHPIMGWPLHVFKYDVAGPNGTTGEEMWLDFLNLDARLQTFTVALEEATVDAAVDKYLTDHIHTFKMDYNPENELLPFTPVLSPVKSRQEQAGGVMTRNQAAKARNMETQLLDHATQRVDANKTYHHKPPKEFMGLDPLFHYISANYGDFAYEPVKLRDMCNRPPGANKDKHDDRIITFTPTQSFVSHYMTPQLPQKGMLLWHSVGSGKTCTAIATATNTFDKQGYTILWVTRHTLKADIWKNMFGQVCNVILREKIAKGEAKLPKKVGKSMTLIGNNWIQPISYKQFSNLLKKENQFYNELVQRNGEEDPLKKTLIVIDEAHKLYASNVMGNEKPDTEVLEKWIDNSYKKSGKSSCRLLLMSATPYLENGLELVKLLNLLRPSDKLPIDFEGFTDRYLDPRSGQFTPKGLTRFQDKIAGYVSYINRSRDGRVFSHPVFHNVLVDLTADEMQKDTDVRNIKKQFQVAAKTYKKAAKAFDKEVKKHQIEAVKQGVGAAYVDCKQDTVAMRKECAASRIAYAAQRDGRIAPLVDKIVAAENTRDKAIAECEEMDGTQKEINGCVKWAKSMARGVIQSLKNEQKAIRTETKEKTAALRDDCSNRIGDRKAACDSLKSDRDKELVKIRKLNEGEPLPYDIVDEIRETSNLKLAEPRYNELKELAEALESKLQDSERQHTIAKNNLIELQIQLSNMQSLVRQERKRISAIEDKVLQKEEATKLRKGLGIEFKKLKLAVADARVDKVRSSTLRNRYKTQFKNKKSGVINQRSTLFQKCGIQVPGYESKNSASDINNSKQSSKQSTQ